VTAIAVQIVFKPALATRPRSKNTDATPVVQMHGMGDFANDPFGMVPLAEAISDYLGGAYVLNVQIGDNNIEDILNGFIMNLDDQVDYFANVVRNDGNLTQGFNAIGYSQGNLVVRGYIERYNDPPVFNFISMHGPLSGVGSFPGCPIDRELCRAVAELLGTLAYYPSVQEHLAQANYFRDPLKIPDYLNGDRFLADINNEDSTVEPGVNATYNSNWASLQSVCLVKALGDTVVIPNDSEWFGFFEDGTFDAVWGFNDSPWYQQDLFGLRTLDIAGRVFFNTTDGNHLEFTTDYLLELVGIYFE
jgi:palmitoyl-protein thioesterase